MIILTIIITMILIIIVFKNVRLTPTKTARFRTQ